jgi:hypothetical protein
MAGPLTKAQARPPLLNLVSNIKSLDLSAQLGGRTQEKRNMRFSVNNRFSPPFLLYVIYFFVIVRKNLCWHEKGLKRLISNFRFDLCTVQDF